MNYDDLNKLKYLRKRKTIKREIHFWIKWKHDSNEGHGMYANRS